MKSYTDLEQSRKLAEILPFESADQSYAMVAKAGDDLNIPEEMQYMHNGDMPFVIYSGIGIPCWSLAALLDALPTLDNKHAVFGTSIKGSKWHVVYHNIDTLFLEDSGLHSNLVDACYEMILKLNELKLL